jgi:iron complex transport system substrate-binding protein
MRVVSLLPSLTELVAALGHRDDLVGVTHECDFPPGVERLPALTRSRIASSASGAEIDALVAEQGGSLYDLDAGLLARLEPDLILTQRQCDVCAVNEAAVRRAADALPGHVAVESVDPTSLAEVHAMFARIGDLLGPDARAAADRLIAGFEATAAAIEARRAGRPPRRLVMLEWLDPPYSCGHWNPEILARSGGLEALGRAGARSRRLSWDEVAAAEPDVIILAPCGFTLDQSAAELAATAARSEWSRLAAVRAGDVFLVDGSAFFSRPGPRLEESLRIAAAAIDPVACGALAPAHGWRRLPWPRGGAV